MRDAEFVNELYETYRDRITGSYHNTLWQILVNGIEPGAFLQPSPDSQIILVRENGDYLPCGCWITGIFDDDEAILSELNERIFGLDKPGVKRVIEASITASQMTA